MPGVPVDGEVAVRGCSCTGDSLHRQQRAIRNRQTSVCESRTVASSSPRSERRRDPSRPRRLAGCRPSLSQARSRRDGPWEAVKGQPCRPGCCAAPVKVKRAEGARGRSRGTTPAAEPGHRASFACSRQWTARLDASVKIRPLWPHPCGRRVTQQLSRPPAWPSNRARGDQGLDARKVPAAAPRARRAASIDRAARVPARAGRPAPHEGRSRMP